MVCRCSVFHTKVVPAAIAQHPHRLDLHARPKAAVVARAAVCRWLVAAPRIHVPHDGNIWVLALPLVHGGAAQGACKDDGVLVGLTLVLVVRDVGRAVRAAALAASRWEEVLLRAASHHAHLALMLTYLHFCFFVTLPAKLNKG